MSDLNLIASCAARVRFNSTTSSSWKVQIALGLGYVKFSFQETNIYFPIVQPGSTF